MVDLHYAHRSTGDRIGVQLLLMWQSEAALDFSIRSLTKAAHAHPSSITYFFGGFDGLLENVQRAALKEAQNWCERQLGELPEKLAGGFLLASVLAELIDRWTAAQTKDRHSGAVWKWMFPWRQCQLDVVRQPVLQPFLKEWNSHWKLFWMMICWRAEISDSYAQIISYFFDGESLQHFARQRRVQDRACLDEACQAFERWLRRERNTDSSWRRATRSKSASRWGSLESPDTKRRIMLDAAIEILVEKGLNAITHRAVAERAGVSLGRVSYRFETVRELRVAALNHIAVKLFRPKPGHDQAEPHLALGATPLFDPQELFGVPATAINELLVGAARFEDIGRRAEWLCYLPIERARKHLSKIAEREVSDAEADVFNSIALGLHNTLTGLSAEYREAQLRSAEAFVIERL